MNEQKYTAIHLIIAFILGIIIMLFIFWAKLNYIEEKIILTNEYISELHQSNTDKTSIDILNNSSYIEDELEELKSDVADIYSYIEDIYYKIFPEKQNQKVEVKIDDN